MKKIISLFQRNYDGNRLRTGCHIVWLDQVLPMYRKNEFRIEAVIGMVKSTNHRFRVATM